MRPPPSSRKSRSLRSKGNDVSAIEKSLSSAKAEVRANRAIELVSLNSLLFRKKTLELESQMISSILCSRALRPSASSVLGRVTLLLALKFRVWMLTVEPEVAALAVHPNPLSHHKKPA